MRRLLSFLFLILLIIPSAGSGEQFAETVQAWENTTQSLITYGVFPKLTLGKGAMGSDVAALQIELTNLGFYTGEITGKYNDAMAKAVKAFEKANDIKADGKLSWEEQMSIYNGTSTTAAAANSPKTSKGAPAVEKETPAESEEPMVWIPKSGKKYHSNSGCSNMKNPSQVSLSAAKNKGLTPCGKCKPPK